MGKGDKKTKRGKIIKGSYGVRRPKKKATTFTPSDKPAAKKTATKKTAAKKKPLSKSDAAKKGWVTRRKNA